jgi:hypothetical protein
MRRIVLTLLALTAASPAFGWGGTGHRYIGETAAKNFPKEIPAFLKTATAVKQIGLLAQEPDISRNSGQPHDDDSDPGHFLDVSDDGTILGGPKLSALPATRKEYDTVLRAAGADQYKAGFLPYNIMDGYQQLVKDFALLRADRVGEKVAKTKAARKAFSDARVLRQVITLRDLGVWAHYVGDASQPMHASVHYDGWGDFPNPQGYRTEKGFHGAFESNFVDAHVTAADVAAKLRPYHACGCTIQQHTQDYLAATTALVVPTFELEKAGAFATATPAARDFTATRIAEGAAMLRDLVTDAWSEAGQVMLGYKHKMTVGDIEAGKSDPSELN